MEHLKVKKKGKKKKNAAVEQLKHMSKNLKHMSKNQTWF